jgi:hypothetical protein
MGVNIIYQKLDTPIASWIIYWALNMESKLGN